MKHTKLLYLVCFALGSVVPVVSFGETTNPPPATTTAIDPIVGRWRLGKSILVVRENGTMTSSSPNFKENGKWELKGSEYTFNWSDGRRITTFMLSPNREKLQRKNNHSVWVDVGEKIHD